MAKRRLRGFKKMIRSIQEDRTAPAGAETVEARSDPRAFILRLHAVPRRMRLITTGGIEKMSTQKSTEEKIKDTAETIASGTVSLAGEVAEKAEKAAKVIAKETVKGAKTVKKAAKDAAKNVKKNVVRSTAKHADPKTAVYLQYNGADYLMQDVREHALEDFKTLHPDIIAKELTIYVKPEEGKAYYVVNQDFTGSVDL